MRASLFRSSLLAAAVTLLVSSTAFAASPTREVFSLNDSYTADPGDLFNPCSEPLSVEFVGTGYYTNFYNQSGDLIRREFRTPRLAITVTGPNGKSLISPSPAINFFTFAETSLTLVVTGLQWRFRIPGSGPVLQAAGRLRLFLPFNDDPFSFSFKGRSVADNAAFCGYLGATY